jgi:transposase-like protein
MKEATPASPVTPSPFAGSDWFDPLEAAVRGHVRSFIEQLLEEELDAALGRGRYERGASSNGRRHGHRPRQLVTTFGPRTTRPRVA